MSEIRKTRNRIPRSCSVCRVRKTKCDKQTPFCGACIKNESEKYCRYEAQQWESSQDTQDFDSPIEETVKEKDHEIIQLKKKISDLRNTLKQSKPYFANSDCMKNEMLNVLAFNNTSRENKNRNSQLYSTDSIANHYNDSIFAVKNLKLFQFAATSYMYYTVLDPSLKQVLLEYSANQQAKFNQRMISLEKQSSECFDQVISSSEKCSSIEKISPTVEFPLLPPNELIFDLIKRFFKFCYVFVPFINEDSLKSEACEILQSAEYYNRSFSSQKSLTFAILLLVLRFSYLTLPFKSFKEFTEKNLLNNLEQNINNDFSLIEILENYPSSSFVPFAKSLLINSNSLDWADFRKIQAFLLLKTYNMYCPEENDRSQNSNYLMALTVQFTRFLGLNQDPENSMELQTLLNLSASDTHLWRKTWGFVCYVDAISAFAGGMMYQVSDEEQSRVLPPFNELNSDGFWMMINGQEYMLKRSFEIRSQVTSLLRKAIKLMNAPNSYHCKSSASFAYSEVNSIRCSFEDILANKLNSWSEMIEAVCDPNSYSFIVEEIIVRIQVTHYIFVLGYYLYLKTSLDKKVQKQYWFDRTTETALVIFKFGYEHATNPRLIIREEYETILSSQVWANVEFPCFFLASMINTFLTENLNNTKPNTLNHSSHIDLSLFQSKEGQQTYQWLMHEKMNTTSHEVNILYKLNLFSARVSKLSVKYYSAYHLSMALKFVLTYFKENYFELFDAFNSNSLPTTDPDLVDEISSHFGDNFSFDQFLQSFNLNIDPFMNLD